MGHSFTSYKDKHIRSKDYKVETWLFLIVREADKILEKEPWLKEARDHWNDQATIAVNGCIDPDLDQYLTDDYKVKVFRSICQRIYSNLLTYGEKIPKEYLNELHNLRPPFDIREDNDAELYLRYGRALLALIDGKQSEECVSA